jgi:hypothetical protein
MGSKNSPANVLFWGPTTRDGEGTWHGGAGRKRRYDTHSGGRRRLCSDGGAEAAHLIVSPPIKPYTHRRARIICEVQSESNHLQAARAISYKTHTLIIVIVTYSLTDPRQNNFDHTSQNEPTQPDNPKLWKTNTTWPPEAGSPPSSCQHESHSPFDFPSIPLSMFFPRALLQPPFRRLCHRHHDQYKHGCQ